jgi:geranylgeranyl pyrophosphate synthase
VGDIQNDSDFPHSLIEEIIKRSLKYVAVYVPSEYDALIRTARNKGKPFKVHDSFLDLTDLTEQTSVNFNIDVTRVKFNFNHICVLRAGKEHPNHFLFKTSDKRSLNVLTLHQIRLEKLFRMCN